MDIRPILSTLRRHKTAAALIVLEIALTCAIVCNALFLIGQRLAGAVVGIRGGYKGLSYDWSVGTPLKKPDGFETANVTSAFTVIWSF